MFFQGYKGCRMVEAGLSTPGEASGHPICPGARPLCSRKPLGWFQVRGEAHQVRPGEMVYPGQPPLGAALHLFSHLGPWEQM